MTDGNDVEGLSGKGLGVSQDGSVIGCGAIVPGFGPGSFPDFDFGTPVLTPGGGDVDPVVPEDPIIDDPQDPDTAPGGPTTPPTTGGPDPSPPGTGGPTTPGTGGPTGPGTSGPITGGPITGPTAGPTGEPNCVCVCTNPTATPSPSTGTGPGQSVWTVTYLFDCKDVLVIVDPIDTLVSNALSNLQQNAPPVSPGFTVIWEVTQESIGEGSEPGGDCSENIPVAVGGSLAGDSATATIKACTGSCKSVKVTFTKTTIPVEQPSDPGTIDGGDVFDGGVVTPPQEPTTPEEPEVPDDPVVPDGNVGGAGPGLSDPLDDSGVVDVKAGLKRFELDFGTVDLSNPQLEAFLSRASDNRESKGSQEAEIAFSVSPKSGTQTPNTSNNKLFGDVIDSNVNYVLSYQGESGTWDSGRASAITPETLYSSLSAKAKELLGGVLNADGQPLSKEEIFTIIGTRLLEGTVDEISLQYLSSLQRSSEGNALTQILPSQNPAINEVVAQALIDEHAYSLDSAKSTGVGRHILPTVKTLATDVDNHIRVSVNGVNKRLYSRDNNVISNGVTLRVRDGNYVNVVRGDRQEKLYLDSETDHAYILPKNIKDQVTTLLGGNPSKVLQVSALETSNIEYESSLSAPRQPVYALSCVLDSIKTVPNDTGSFLLKNTQAQYALVDISTQQKLDEFNEYIKYKANREVYLLDDEDLMLDYIESTSSLTIAHTDVISDSNKENKTIKLLTRDVPWYILVYPTNRADLLTHKTKSKIVSTDNGVITRELSFRNTIAPELSKSNSNKFVKVKIDTENSTNIFGEEDTEARIFELDLSDEVFQRGYQKDGNYMSASAYTPDRKKTGLRVVREVVKELKDNYILERNGTGNILTEFDVFSRLSYREFIRFTNLENYNLYKGLTRQGFFEDVRIIPPVAKSSKDVVFSKTSLRKRKKAAPAEDTFTVKKLTNTNRRLIPPTNKESGRLV